LPRVAALGDKGVTVSRVYICMISVEEARGGTLRYCGRVWIGVLGLDTVVVTYVYVGVRAEVWQARACRVSAWAVLYLYVYVCGLTTDERTPHCALRTTAGLDGTGFFCFSVLALFWAGSGRGVGQQHRHTPHHPATKPRRPARALARPSGARELGKPPPTRDETKLQKKQKTLHI